MRRDSLRASSGHASMFTAACASPKGNKPIFRRSLDNHIPLDGATPVCILTGF